MRRWRLVGCAFAILLSLPFADARGRAAPEWAIDPARPGLDSPPAGRSLFDFMVTSERDGKLAYDVPFPFEALVQRIEERIGCAPSPSRRAPCVKQVLIPLGRSLQRTAAAPDFFRYPRAVAAVDGESEHARAPFAKDRLYLGYQEQANLIEVISYNEAAGRFEFQLVTDYRPGGKPQVSYARRAVCAACHQNLAPIFSRQVWQETNANPRVAAALESMRTDFYGIPVRRGVDIPEAIDAATDRANLLSAWQRLWREGCGDGAAGAACRAAVLIAALQYRLSGERAFDDRAPEWRDAFLRSFMHEWDARWPAGLAIPNPDIPNRDPLPQDGPPPPTGVAAAHVAAALEPLAPRPPLEVWTQAETARRFVTGLAEFITTSDVSMLDKHLAARAATVQRRYDAPCTAAWTERVFRFECSGDALRASGRVELSGPRTLAGEITEVAIGEAAPLRNFAIQSGALDDGRLSLTLGSRPGSKSSEHGLRARLADGSAISNIELRWRPGQVRTDAGMRRTAAQITIAATEDFAPVRAAVAALANDLAESGVFDARPFGRARVLSAVFDRLKLPSRDWCCEDVSLLPSLAVEPAAPRVSGAQPKEYAAFYPLCASCHATSERFPPNFLAGSGASVAAAMKHCAPRIYVRLAQWRLAPSMRAKTPMPPAIPAVNPIADPPPAGVEGLERSIADLLRVESGAAPRLDAMLARGYEALRPCLPPN
jgi:hypothetical protein